tara:strand:- start:251 stop:355 length:105 start_codon:yes stop_codon:yes gene_type:complete
VNTLSTEEKLQLLMSMLLEGETNPSMDKTRKIKN